VVLVLGHVDNGMPLMGHWDMQQVGTQLMCLGAAVGWRGLSQGCKRHVALRCIADALCACICCAVL
jgi:hypothetical protein